MRARLGGAPLQICWDAGPNPPLARWEEASQYRRSVTAKGDDMETPARREKRRPPLHPGYIGAGATLLIAAFVTDVVYYETSNWQWANFSAWLIAAGLLVALLATVVLVVDIVTRRAHRISWISFFNVAAAALLSLVNVFVHSRDGWTSVTPQGLGLSTVVAVLLLVAAARGWRVTPIQAALAEDRI